MILYSYIHHFLGDSPVLFKPMFSFFTGEKSVAILAKLGAEASRTLIL